MKATAAMPLKQLVMAAITAATGADGIGMDLPSLSGGQIVDAIRLVRQDPRPEDRSLVRFSDALHLDDFELAVVALLRAVETDPVACRLVGTAQAPLAGARPTLGLLAVSFSMFGVVEQLMSRLSSGPAFRSGCFALGPEDAPLPERSICLARPILDALGQGGAPPQGVVLLPHVTYPLHDALLEDAKVFRGRLATRPEAGVIIRANSEVEAIAAASHLARAIGLKAALIGPDVPAILPAWLLAAGAVPVFHAFCRPGERKQIPDLSPYSGAWLCVTNGEGLVEANRALSMNWLVPPCLERARDALWQGNGLAPEAAREAARALRIGPSRIARLATATAGSTGKTSGKIAWADIASTVALDAHASLTGLARKVEGKIDDDAFVCPRPIAERMQQLLGRCRLREGLAGHLGPAANARFHAGVRALFHGPSGTGKSLAAQWLASVIGLPIYRVDLAAVTSKWIGETEKNIGQLLSAAEELDVILLFDEADSLFSARTDVGNANDRHANSQTNYLLQRLESHEGIVILTSNARDRLDGAFTRRLDAIIEFPMPDVEARRAIWRAHLEKGSLPDADINHLAAVIDLAGGHIRNLVLSAAVMSDGAAPGLPHFVAAAKLEYQKLGRQVPRDLEQA